MKFLKSLGVTWYVGVAFLISALVISFMTKSSASELTTSDTVSMYLTSAGLGLVCFSLGTKVQKLRDIK